MGRLIIDDTTIYEIDEECLRQKNIEKNEELTKAQKRSGEGKGVLINQRKERPAP